MTARSSSGRVRSCASCRSTRSRRRPRSPRRCARTGIDAVQATVSRDIAQLGLVKVRNAERPARLRAPGRRRPAPARRADRRTCAAGRDASTCAGPIARRRHAARLRRRARRRDRRRRASRGRRHDRRRQHRLRRRARRLHRRRSRSGVPPAPGTGRPRVSTRSAPPGGAILSSLPVGERVGIAFSGGLDTCCALAWMREHGAIPYAFTADLGQYDEPDVGAVPTARAATAPRTRSSSTARTRSRAKASPRCSAARSTSRPRAAATSTPPRSAAPSPARCSCRRWRAHGVDIWGDGSTYKGNDIERFYRYGLLANQSLRIYKPWLDSAFVGELGGRKEMSEWLAARGLAARHLGREGVLDRREPARRDARGEGSRAALDLDEDRRADHGRRALGPRGRDRAGDRHDRVRERPPPGRRLRVDVDPHANDDRRPPRPRHVRPDREPRSSRRRAAASTRRPAWRCCTSRTSGCSRAIHNEATLERYSEEGRRLGRLLYEGRWFDVQALMLRDSLQRWVAAVVTRRGDDRAAPRRRLHDPRHDAAKPSRTTRSG